MFFLKQISIAYDILYLVIPGTYMVLCYRYVVCNILNSILLQRPARFIQVNLFRSYITSGSRCIFGNTSQSAVLNVWKGPTVRFILLFVTQSLHRIDYSWRTRQ